MALLLSFAVVSAVDGDGANGAEAPARRTSGRLSRGAPEAALTLDDGSSLFLEPARREVQGIRGTQIAEADLRVLLSVSFSSAEPNSVERTKADIAADLRVAEPLFYRYRTPTARDAIPEPKPLLLLGLGLALLRWSKEVRGAAAAPRAARLTR